MPPFSKFLMLTALAGLTGCSEYLDRTDTMSWQSGNAMQTNKLTHMVDPWPVVSRERNIAFNGERMETAVARYRTGKVIQPRGMSSDPAPVTPAATPATNTAPLGPTVNAQSGVK